MDPLPSIKEYIHHLAPTQARRVLREMATLVHEMNLAYESLERCHETYERYLPRLRTLCVSGGGNIPVKELTTIYNRVFRGHTFPPGCFLDTYADLRLFYELGKSSCSEETWIVYKNAMKCASVV